MKIKIIKNTLYLNYSTTQSINHFNIIFLCELSSSKITAAKTTFKHFSILTTHFFTIDCTLIWRTLQTAAAAVDKTLERRQKRERLYKWWQKSWAKMCELNCKLYIILLEKKEGQTRQVTGRNGAKSDIASDKHTLSTWAQFRPNFYCVTLFPRSSPSLKWLSMRVCQ